MNWKVCLRFLALAALCNITLSLHAQSTMTDEQVIKFVMAENEKGTSRADIQAKLVRRGVTMEQVRRVRDKYEKEKGKSLLGSKELLEKDDKERLRKNNGEKKKANDYRRRKNRADEMRDMRDMPQDAYGTELDFLFPDTLDVFDRYLNMKEDRSTQIFGHNIFNRKDLTFEPPMNIATPPNYQLGAGDVVFIDIWGASQKSIQATVSPEGTVDIENYGPVEVGGMTVAQANQHLKATLGQRFTDSNVRLTVGQTKTITVNVMGEVEMPGTFTLSAFASVFHALYMAGGANDIGTLRNIKLYRKNKLVSTIDIYDYILNGKQSGNVRLADNDVIVVGPYDKLISVTGKVKRPMFYEMKDNENVETALKYAGGFAGDAYQKYVRVRRNENGKMSVYNVAEFDRANFTVMNGDTLMIDSLIERYNNVAEVKGAVFRPGLFQTDGSIHTVRELLEAAGGVTEDAFLERAVMHRRKEDRTLEVLAIDLNALMKQTIPDIPLRNEDVLYVHSKKELQEERTFSIFGEVVYPGVYNFAENTSLEDLVLQAGGLKDAASYVKIDVSRRTRDSHALTTSGDLAKTFSFALKEGLIVDGTPGFILEPFDEVYVRRSPGYVEQKHVQVNGEVAFAGKYALAKHTQRLSDLVEMAGGLTKDAYAQGAHLKRQLTEAEKEKQKALIKMLNSGDSINVNRLELGDTRAIGIDLEQALKNPGSDEWDLVLEEGDELIIPQYSNTVSISGDVMFPNAVSYKKGAKLKYYINQAGGYGMGAKKSHVFVVHMNGTVSRADKLKEISPGSEIVVPSKMKKKGVSLPEMLGIGSTMASLGAIIVSLLR